MAVLSLTIDHGVGTITLDRGGAGNPFDVTFCTELLAAIHACHEPEAGVRAVLLRSNGPNFSYGGDLRWLAAQGDRMHEAASEPVGMLNEAILKLSLGDAPLVVAVNGMAAGGAVGLVSAADFVVAGSDARFYAAFVGIGLSCDTGCSFFLPRLVGLRRATNFLMLNEIWDAETAEEAGLVSHRVANTDVEGTARELAAKLAAGPTIAFGEMRRLLRAYAPLEQQLLREAHGIARTAETDDMPMAVHAVLAKSAPVFKGA
jgi:2-(1,2-epoxy-1,2-dihydrophenyl)acetyl-CoA isomerase